MNTSTPIGSFAHALFMAAMASTAGLAGAQSVTVFGVLDVNLRTVKNGSAESLRSESSDGLSTSRLGFRGLEDLGDGLMAGFWLESSVVPDTGSSNVSRFWDRRATVSIIDPTFGEVRLGRDSVPTYAAIGTYDAFGTNGLGEVIGNGTGTGIIGALGSGANTLKRADNQVSYFLPATLGGAYGQFAVAAGEGPAGNKQIAGRVGYAAGPLNVSVAYAETTVAAGDKFKQVVLGGSYDFGVARVLAQFVQAKFASTAGGPRKQNVYEVGAVVPLGRGEFHVGYISANMSGGAALSGFGNDDDASQFAMSYLYNFSKRTALYATGARLSNKGASKLILATGASGMKPGETSTGFEAGIRHSF
ncbi:MAG: porin [Rhizobacter sp.]|nr:porin [Rhizobacter sp.]